MNTHQMEYIIAVAEEGRQSRAAERLMVSQPAVSQQVHKVEKELGTPLFQKENGRLVLTDAGKIYVNGARSVLNVYNNALSDIRKIRTRKKKQINLSYNSTLLPDIEGVLSAFAKTHPDIFISALSMNSSVSRDYLKNSLSDIAVMARTSLSSNTLDFTVLKEDEICMLMSKEDPLVRKFKKGIRWELLEDSFFILNEPDSFISNETHRLFQHNQFIPQKYCDIADLSAAVKMAVEDQGITFVPKSFPIPKEAVIFPLSLPFYIVAAERKNYISGPGARDLVRLLKESLQ